jgi:ATP-dependent RNA helicase DeaD
VILCPTRELCLQITEDLKGYGRYLPRIRVAAVYGGASIAHQIRQLRDGSQIVVATPGRLIDLMQRRAGDLSHTATCVLDEADEMLNMGFQEDIDRILKQHAGQSPDLAVFSHHAVRRSRPSPSTYLDDPCKVSLGGRRRMAPNITHACLRDERAPPLPGAQTHHRLHARNFRAGVLPHPQGNPSRG